MEQIIANTEDTPTIFNQAMDRSIDGAQARAINKINNGAIVDADFVTDYITDSVKSITDDSANGKFQYRHIHPADLQAYIQSLKDTANSASRIAGGIQID